MTETSPFSRDQHQTQSVVWRKFSDFQSLEPLAQEWDSLLAKSEFPNIFCAFGFAKAWWRIFGKQRNLHAWCLFDSSGKLRLIAPFCAMKTTPSRWQTVACIGGDYGNVIFSKEDTEAPKELVKALFDDAQWKEILVQHLPGEQGAFSLALPSSLESGKSTKWQALTHDAFPLAIRTSRRIHPFVAGEALKKLSGLLEKRRYRQYVRWFETQGKLEYVCLSDPDEIRALLPKFREQHIEKFRAKGKTSWFLNPEVDGMEDALLEALPEGVPRLHTLTLSGNLIASHFGFEWGKRLYWYVPCYDPRFASRSPGKLLLAYALREANANGMEEFDFLTGLESYKLELASAIRETHDLHIFRDRWSLAQNYLSRLRKRLRG